MAFIFFLFVCQLLLAVAEGSDKHLKDVPKTEQEIDTGNENETDTVIVFVPQVNDCLDDAHFVVGQNGESDWQETLQDQPIDSVYFYLESPECTYNGDLGHAAGQISSIGHNVTETIPDESSNLDTSESTDPAVEKMTMKTDADSSAEDLLHTADVANDDVDDTAVDNTIHQDSRIVSYESPPEITSTADLIDDTVLESMEASKLDPIVANARISDMRSAFYQQLADALENMNTYGGIDPWWNFLILHCDDLDISRKEQRYIERSTRPGLEFLDILDESGFTMRQLENIFMRFKMHEALHILRSRQMEVKGRGKNGRTYSEQKAKCEVESRVIKKENRDNVLDNTDMSQNNGDAAVNKEQDLLMDPAQKVTGTPKEKTQASDTDHCMSNPCRNEGTCITDRDGYTCKCAYRWFTGKHCETDIGPCSENACHKEGTRSCSYNGYDGQYTSCNCKIGYDGDQCETEHDYSKYPPIRNIVDSCNERGLSQNECIADTFDINNDDNTPEELLEKLLQKDVKDTLGTISSKLFYKEGTPVQVISGVLEQLLDKDVIGTLVKSLKNFFIDGKPAQVDNFVDGDAEVENVVEKFKTMFN